MQEPSVLNYTNYRLFLRELYAYRKTERATYSFRELSKDFGFTASNFLHLVIAGQRNLSTNAINKIKSNVRWSAQAKKYFQHLVLFNQATKPEERKAHLTELEKILGKKRTLLKPDQYRYFSHWFMPVLKELVALKGFVSHLNWISKKLKPQVPEDEVREGLRVLENLKMIEKKGGKWVQSQEHLTTPREVNSDMIHHYHQEMLRLSLSALGMPSAERDVSAMTMSLSEAQYDWLKQRVMDFRDEIQQELQGMTDAPTRVAQLNIQLFPVTEE